MRTFRFGLNAIALAATLAIAQAEAPPPRTALVIDGQLELPLGDNNRTVDVWLEAGAHDIAIFSAMTNGFPTVGASGRNIARAPSMKTRCASSRKASIAPTATAR